jgi:hypothetical protein
VLAAERTDDGVADLREGCRVRSAGKWSASCVRCGSDARVASVSDKSGDSVMAVSGKPGEAVSVSNKSGAPPDRSGDTILVSNKSGSRRGRVR